MTTAISALDHSSRAAHALASRAARGSRGSKGLLVLLLAPVVLIVAAILYTLLGSHRETDLLGTWAVLWFTAFGVIALVAGSLIDGAFKSVDAVREAQARKAS